MKEIVGIQVSKYLTNEWVAQIAQKQWGTSSPRFVNRSRQYVFDQLVIDENECFGVVAIALNDELVGRLHCVRNKSNPSLWYYGDLFVVPEYRRQGIAKQMIRTAMQHLSETGAVQLRCYVAPDNLPSRNLQLSIGFEEKPFETFNDFENEGDVMFEIAVPGCFTCVPATEDEAYFVRVLFVMNRDRLNIGDISMDEWRQKLSTVSDNEKNFLICKGAMPIAYMQIAKGEMNNKIAIFFAAEGVDYNSVLDYAVNFAEKYPW